MDYQTTKRSNPYFLTLLTLCISLLTACLSGGNHGSTDSKNIVGLHTVADATITVEAADGALLATTVSDNSAHYQTMVSAGADYPYTVTATSGIDLITGTPSTYPRITVITGPDNEIANINTFTTLIVKTAEAMPGGLISSNLSQAGEIILQQLNFGMDPSLVPDPITTAITAQNAASLIKANEALKEMIRRVHASLQVVGYDLNEADIIADIAGDLSDGYLDGNGPGEDSALIAATVNIVSGQVLVEGLGNNLNINGTWATNLLDNAIRTVVPEVTDTTADVTITGNMIQQTKTAISAAQAISPSEPLSTLALIVNRVNTGMNATDIEIMLPEERRQDFNEAMIASASASDSQLTSINAVVHQADSNSSPDDNLLALAWLPSDGDLLGYIVYYGPSPVSATMIASETSSASVKFYRQADLGLDPGDSVCFRLKAVNLAGLSDFSGAACMVL